MSEGLARQAGRAVVWRAAQLFGGKAISLARFFILARLLSPDDFGLLAIAAIAMETTLSLTSLGVSSALVQRDKLEKEDYDTAWTLAVLRGLVVAAVLAIWAPAIAELFNEPRATAFIRVLGLKPLLDAMASVRLVDLTRGLRFQHLALLQVSSAALETAGAVLLVLILPPLLADAAVSVALVQAIGAWSLIAGAFAGSLLSVIVSYVLAPYRPRLRLDVAVARALVRFGRWVLLTHLVGMAGHVVLRAVISNRLGPAELGLFYLALKLTVLPNDVVGEVIRSVAFPIVSRVKGDTEMVRRAFQASLGAMWAVLVPIYVAMIALAGPITVLLGPQWADLLPVIQLLAIDGIVDVLADAMSPLLLGVGAPQRQTALKGVRTVVLVAAVFPLTSAFGVVGAATAWVVAEAAQGLLAAYLARSTLPRPFWGMGGRLAAIGVAGAAAGAVALLVDAVLDGIPALFVGGALGLAVSAVLLLALDRRYGLGMTGDFGRAFPAVASRLGLARESD